MSDEIEPFRVAVDDAQLEDLRSRLARTRFPDQIPGTGWEAGIPIAYLRELVDYWLVGYDWRREEARLNEFAQFRTRIDGQSIHFIHARSPHEDALPLLLSHGWPGSIVEFLDVIPRLTDPPAYGGRAADAFHVVAPSLPGYGFSEPPRTRGWDVRRIAEAFIVLMDRLGYGRYGAQGGDWGAQVTTRIGALDPAHCAAIHLNMPIGVRPAEPGDAHRRGAVGPRRHAPLHQPGVRLRQRAGDQAPDGGCRPERLAGRTAGVDRGEVPGLERLRRATPRTPSPGTSS